MSKWCVIQSDRATQGVGGNDNVVSAVVVVDVILCRRQNDVAKLEVAASCVTVS